MHRDSSPGNRIDCIITRLTLSIAEAADLARENGFDDAEFREIVEQGGDMLDALASALRGHTLH